MGRVAAIVGAMSGSSSERAAALVADASAAFQRGDNDETKRLATEAVKVAREAGEDRTLATALTWMARTAFRDGDTTLQRRFANDALAAAELTGDLAATFGPRHLLVAADRADGRLEEACRGYESTRELARRVGNDRAVTMETLNIAGVSLLLGRVEAALVNGLEALRAAGDPRLAAVCISILGGAVLASGDADRGARLLGAAEGMIARTGTVFDPDDDSEHQGRVTKAIAAIGEPRYARAGDEGRTLTDQEARDLALG